MPGRASQPAARRRPIATADTPSITTIPPAPALLFLQPESGFQRYLEMRDGAIDDVAAGFHHFEPVQILHRLRGALDRVADRGVGAIGGRTYQLDNLVSVLGHVVTFLFVVNKGVPASADDVPWCRYAQARPAQPALVQADLEKIAGAQP